MWIAFMLLCTGASALTCEVMAKTEATFSTEEACVQEAMVVARYFQQQGYLAIPEFKKIKMGVSL